ncbi:MAG: hypothetical protein P8J27_09770 [Mariniblastus sp.]|nr:hypothetical protein [Mariniblastus sp.]
MKATKNIANGDTEPAQDTDLKQYGIYAATAPRAEKKTPLKTTLPLEFDAGDRVAFIGNMLL